MREFVARPSKNEIRSAEVAHLARHAAEFGAMTGPVKVDMAIVRRRKRDMVDAQVAAHLHNYKTKRRGIDHGDRTHACDVWAGAADPPALPRIRTSNCSGCNMRLLRLCHSDAGLGRVGLMLAASGRAPVHFHRDVDEFEMSISASLPAAGYGGGFP
jgi:hypothetical protein